MKPFAKPGSWSTPIPDAAYDLLKRQLGSVRDNGDLSESVRSTLGNRLESALRTVQAEGAKVKLKQDIDLRTRIAVEARRSADVARASEEEKDSPTSEDHRRTDGSRPL